MAQKDEIGLFPMGRGFPVNEDLDCPEYIDVNENVPDSARPMFPPKGNLVSANDIVQEAAWGGSETRRIRIQQGKKA